MNQCNSSGHQGFYMRDVRKVGYDARRAMSSANEGEGKLS